MSDETTDDHDDDIRLDALRYAILLELDTLDGAELAAIDELLGGAASRLAAARAADDEDAELLDACSYITACRLAGLSPCQSRALDDVLDHVSGQTYSARVEAAGYPFGDGHPAAADAN